MPNAFSHIGRPQVKVEGQGEGRGGEEDSPFKEPADGAFESCPRANESPVLEPALEVDVLCCEAAGGTARQCLVAAVGRVEEYASDAGVSSK